MPDPRPRLLLLGGSTEAAALARALAADGAWEATLSLAGRTQAPAAAALPTRVGGFGGAAALAAWLREHWIAAVVDATHPFAARMGANAAAACVQAGVALLRLSRPGWTAQPGDRWTRVADLDAAAAHLAREPARRVLLTTGQALAPFLRAPAHRYVVRCIERPPLLPPGAELILARGPFSRDAELALLRGRGIGLLVTKDAGGTAVAAKLEAARELGVAVLMVARPPRPAVPEAADVAGALAWLAALRGR